MSRKERHNREVRERIVKGAGRLFRRHGYDGVGLNDLMAEAGLTRGAFYAHFRSKEALLTAVMQSEHPLLRDLEARDATSAETLWQGMMQIFGDYLSYEYREEIRAGCSLAGLTLDVARASDETRAAQDTVTRAVEAEMVREQAIPADHPNVTAALTLALGAIAQARAAQADARQRQILTAARASFFALMTAARAEHSK